MAMTLITTNTSSNAATSDFTSSIDSTYKLYIFKFYDINAATDATRLTFQVNADGESGYNETITSTAFNAYHAESDEGTPLVAYAAGLDQAEGTAAQYICSDMGNGADESAAGILHLFNPSSTTYVTHWYSRFVTNRYDDVIGEFFMGGYINTTAAIDEVQFKMSSGNMDAVIKMYGVG
jgi:hypothetical protein